MYSCAEGEIFHDSFYYRYFHTVVFDMTSLSAALDNIVRLLIVLQP